MSVSSQLVVGQTPQPTLNADGYYHHPIMFSISSVLVLTIFSILTPLPLVSAQFQFFDQMFGHGQRRHQPPASSQWAAQADMGTQINITLKFTQDSNMPFSVPCNNYLCPTTLSCVINPADCPCHYVEDKKCLIPDSEIKGAATVVCVRGPNGCADVDRLSNG